MNRKERRREVKVFNRLRLENNCRDEKGDYVQKMKYSDLPKMTKAQADEFTQMQSKIVYRYDWEAKEKMKR